MSKTDIHDSTLQSERTDDAVRTVAEPAMTPPASRTAHAPVPPASRASPPTRGAQPGRRRRPLVIGGIVLVAAIAGLWFWLSSRNQVGTDNAHLDGHVVPVTARVTGYVKNVRIAENQVVNAGDTLIDLDDRDLRMRLAQADADLDALLATIGDGTSAGQSRAQLEAARATAAAAQAAVARAESNAERATNDAGRYRALAATNTVSRQQLDNAEAAARAADAELTAARRNAQAAAEQVVAAGAALRGAGGRVDAARAARDQIALQLEFTHITAAVGGVVTKRAVEPGQQIQPGQPLMTVVPLDSIWAVANIKETDIRDIRVGDPVDLDVDAYPGVRFEGTVESISPATGSTFSLIPPDNATGNFVKVVQRIPVRIRVSQSEYPDTPLRPGMSVDVTIHTKS